MSAATTFSLTLAALVFVMMAAAGIGLTLDRSDWNEEQKQEVIDESEEVAEDHQTNPPTFQSSDASEHPNEDKWHGNQSRFQERQLRVAIGLNVITLALAIPAAFGLYILVGTLNATRTAADAAKQQAVAARVALRPWVSTANEDGMSDTLTFAFKPNWASVDYSLDIPLKNFGHSPATQVTPLASLIWGPYKDVQNKLDAFGKYKCGPVAPLDMFLQFGTFVPPEARIFYPAPSAETLFGKQAVKPGDKIQIWLIVCLAYYNPSDAPPSLHHTCTRHMFLDENGKGDISVIQGSIKGKFMPMNGGCAR
jgi:hypothetical protein